VGAHWTGKSGYTDGIQRLCTPAERDVGFPYASKGGEQVDLLMHSQFSWQSYLLSQPHDYSRWVDHGARPPRHRDFARYLAWVVQRSAATLVLAEVTRLHPVRGKWVVQSRKQGDRRASRSIEFDGVVMTSPGPARRLPMTGKSPRRFDGDDFWRRLREIPRLVRKADPSEQIAIIGAGGTAAAILAWLCRNGFKAHEIVMVANQAALFTRGDSVFENRLFSDEETWRTLSKESREQFFNRLNRGVVWGTVMEEVASATGLVFVDGRASNVKADREGSLQVSVGRGDGANVDLRPAVLVDASGFDNWWFLDLIEGLDAAKRNDRKYLESLRDGMEPDLSFSKPWKFPRLHAPAHSSLLGPGYGSLMSLGGMSDLILSRYTNRPE
jgi:mycobactin lysine-N-oxygenase